MSTQTHPVIFDGHNDLLMQLHRKTEKGQQEAYFGGQGWHLDAEKMRNGGFAGGFFAIYVPSPGDSNVRHDEMAKPAYDIPLPPPLSPALAMDVTMHQAAILFRLEAQGALTICRTVADMRAAIAADRIAAILHVEGADGIDPDLNALDVLYQAGLRSLGPVWSRPNRFGEGVPLRFPGDPDIGAGLTEDGIRLVRRCNALGIMVDLSHLNAAGFWDVARVSDKPLVATHSNAHALCAHARNLTDDQLRAIRDSDGMVGLNFAVAFLREDGRMLEDVPLDQMLRHLDHLIGIVGEDRVGFGSDFDGAIVPRGIGTAAGLPALRTAMRQHGYDTALMTKLCHGNWIRVLDATWSG